MDLIEDIGPILGIVAFLGFAILALLIVLQAREVRRLREWAGRAPERALEADEGDKAAAEARGEDAAEEEKEPGRIAALRARVAGAVGPRWEGLDRRSPIDPRWFLAALLAGVIAVGVVTSGFGLVGDDDATPTEESSRGGGGSDEPKEPKLTVAVLNATQVDDPVAPVDAVAGIADVVAEQVVKPADFKVGERTNAPAGEEKSVIMFQPDAEAGAEELAAAVEPELGTTEILPITDEIDSLVGDADLVLLVGQDDADFGQDATDTAVP